MTNRKTTRRALVLSLLSLLLCCSMLVALPSHGSPILCRAAITRSLPVTWTSS